MRSSIAIFVAVVQSILLAAHFFVFETWLHFWNPALGVAASVRLVVFLLAVSFVSASLLSFKYWNAATRGFYRASAIWLGIFNFLFLAAAGTWLTELISTLGRFRWNGRIMAAAWFAAAILSATWGIINASLTRVSRIKVRLPNLPVSWQGRTAAMISDLHLGHVRGANFARNIVARIRQLRPEIVFLAGDLYDGGYADLDALAGPLRGLNAPLGHYFVAGNHEEMRNPGAHLEAAKNAGLRLLNNEKVVVDGMQIIGVHYHEASHPERLNTALERCGSIASRLVCCWCTRRINWRWPKKREFPCSCRGIPIVGSFSHGPCSPGVCTNNLPMGCSGLARCWCTPRAAPERGVRPCGCARTRKLC